MCVLLQCSSILHRTKWIVIHGTKYKEDDYVLWKFEGEVPIFARIKAIILPELSEPKFVIFPLVTVTFSSHFHAYEVVYRHTISFEVHVCNQTDFVDHNVLSVYQPYNSPSTNFISLKYYVLNEYD